MDTDQLVCYENVSIFPTPNNKPLTVKEIKDALPVLKCRLDCYARVWKVVALGKTAAKALTLLGVEFYEMPHPSGLNRQLNDPEFIEGKINGLRDYLSPSKID